MHGVNAVPNCELGVGRVFDNIELDVASAEDESVIASALSNLKVKSRSVLFILLSDQLVSIGGWSSCTAGRRGDTKPRTSGMPTCISIAVNHLSKKKILILSSQSSFISWESKE